MLFRCLKKQGNSVVCEARGERCQISNAEQGYIVCFSRKRMEMDAHTNF